MMKIYRAYLSDLGRLLAAASIIVGAVVAAFELIKPGIAVSVVSPQAVILAFAIGAGLALFEERR